MLRIGVLCQERRRTAASALSPHAGEREEKGRCACASTTSAAGQGLSPRLRPRGGGDRAAARHFAHRALPFRKGEVAKIETLEKLAELLKVSVPTLLGVGVEYIASAVGYFERMRQIEETAEHIIVLAGPISYVLASDGFDGRSATSCASRCPTASPSATARWPRSMS